jgi:hypothetical protein
MHVGIQHALGRPLPPKYNIHHSSNTSGDEVMLVNKHVGGSRQSPLNVLAANQLLVQDTVPHNRDSQTRRRRRRRPKPGHVSSQPSGEAAATIPLRPPAREVSGRPFASHVVIVTQLPECTNPTRRAGEAEPDQAPGYGPDQGSWRQASEKTPTSGVRRLWVRRTGADPRPTGDVSRPSGSVRCRRGRWLGPGLAGGGGFRSKLELS